MMKRLNAAHELTIKDDNIDDDTIDLKSKTSFKRKRRIQFVFFLFFLMYPLIVYRLATPAIVLNPSILEHYNGYDNCEYYAGLKECKEKLKVGIITFQKGYDNNLVKNTIENKQRYAAKHSYDLIIADEMVKNVDKPAWEKFSVILHYLKDYDFVLWLDTDAIIINNDVKIECLTYKDNDLYFSEDENGINSGVMLIKNSKFSEWFLKEAKSLKKKFYDNGPFQYEQRAIHFMYNTKSMISFTDERYPYSAKVQSHTNIIHHCAMNTNTCEELNHAVFLFSGRWILKYFGICNNYYQPGNFIIHVAGKNPKFYRKYLINRLSSLNSY